MTEYATRNPSMSPAVGVARVSVRLLVGALAIITALETLGVPVAPLVTTLGVGSLAVALALQETLANFFAGLYLLADRPVRAGDYIKINDAQGEEGYVESIGWRSSRLRTLKNNTVIVPNQKLSQAILTNFQPAGRAGGDGGQRGRRVDRGADRRRGLPQRRAHARGRRAAARSSRGKPAAFLIDLTDAGQVWSCGVQVADVEAQGPAGTRAAQASAGAAAARGDRARRAGAAHPRQRLRSGQEERGDRRDGERRETARPAPSSPAPSSGDPKR